MARSVRFAQAPAKVRHIGADPGVESLSSNAIQQCMFRELQDKTVFEAARANAYDYIAGIRDRSVAPDPAALAGLSAFDEPMPRASGNATDIVEQLHRFGSPATMASTGGRYYGLVVGSALPVSLGVRWLTDVWDQCSTLYNSSPVAAKLESIAEAWLVDLFGLPDPTVAGFVSGTSAALLCGLAAARERALHSAGWDVNARGIAGAPPLRIVAGRHVHATVLKAVALLGLGLDSIEWVDVDLQGRIRVDLVPDLDSRTILVLQAGNVNSGAFDDFASLVPRAREAGAWVHVDGAFGLWAACSSRLRHLTRGIELADSWSVDGHNTLNAPYDNGIILCRHPDTLVRALQAQGAYIGYSAERDNMRYTPEMSRRARGAEIWACLKYLGRDGLDEMISGLHLRAAELGALLATADFEIANDIVFNQLLVRGENDEVTRSIAAHLQSSGECWAGLSEWFGRPVVRVSICSWSTTSDDVSRTARAFIAARAAAAGA